MTEIIRLDVHAHLIAFDGAPLARFTGVDWDPSARKLVVDGHAIGLANLFNPGALIAWMDEHRVERAWISVPPPVYRQQLAADDAARWAAALNDELIAIARENPDRFAPLLHLPVEHPGVAAQIVGAGQATGQRRFAMAAGAPSSVLSAPAYEALWQALDAVKGFLFLHPGEGCDARLDAFYLHNLLGNPVETAIAASHLVFGGVLERYPGIEICLAHAGGVTAALAGRWERGHVTVRPGLDAGKEAPRKALRRFCVDCIGHDRGALDLAASVFGPDRVLFGSDWPFPMGLPKPHAQLADLDPQSRKRIFCDNPQRFD
ncbi:amidohydrolase [Bradyrhizobium sp. CCGUVB1N3]|uniref:amidohydrolase family protein n=1 Tax=Bradyrhizobium sp. CCGUVB1N3 TaxID=2949629 RepID=UPI0020B2F2F1|nr:amidohydrolase family protein [Bradyrhizobium sp. CCGUVB1N3]MCP3469051.1 amidohydrolase [Bradyrhizobium sp. CCGUVB1N3]